MAYMNETIYKRYVDLLDKGLTKRDALLKVGVPRSTMRDYINRRINDLTYPYHILKKSSGITIVIDGAIYKVTKHFAEKERIFIQSLLLRNDMKVTQAEKKKIEILKFSDKVVKSVSVNKDFKLKNGKAYYKKYELSLDLFNAAKAALSKSGSNKTNKISNFLDLLVENPDKDVIKQLYPFLIHNDIEICDNGYILAYKAINRNFKDIRTNSIDNSVGKRVTMDRNDVDSNSNNTCSVGLHVGSLSYIEKIYKDVIIVKCILNPKDVVSVPKDYNGAKCRVCEYKVVGVHSD